MKAADPKKKMCRAHLIIFLVLAFLKLSKSDITIEEGQNLLMEKEEVMLKVNQLVVCYIYETVVSGGKFLAKAAFEDEVEIF